MKKGRGGISGWDEENFIVGKKRVKRQERQVEGKRSEVQVDRPSAVVLCMRDNLPEKQGFRALHNGGPWWTWLVSS